MPTSVDASKPRISEGSAENVDVEALANELAQRIKLKVRKSDEVQSWPGSDDKTRDT